MDYLDLILHVGEDFKLLFTVLKDDLNKIIVVPVFVAHGLHTKRDIPQLLGIESDFDPESVGSWTSSPPSR